MTAITTVAGEELELRPERAAYWRRTQTLLIADPHFGKAASFRALGVYVPKGTTTSALARIDTLIADHAPSRIIFLGDFLHSREGRNAETFNELAHWRESHAAIAMQIVRGNHDKRAGDPPCEVGLDCVDGPIIDGPFAFAHHPVAIHDAYVIGGHIHPCATLTGPARQRERLPCFAFHARVGVLPAFGEFTGCAEVNRTAETAIWVVAGDRVVNVGAN